MVFHIIMLEVLAFTNSVVLITKFEANSFHFPLMQFNDYHKMFFHYAFTFSTLRTNHDSLPVVLEIILQTVFIDFILRLALLFTLAFVCGWRSRFKQIISCYYYSSIKILITYQEASIQKTEAESSASCLFFNC